MNRILKKNKIKNKKIKTIILRTPHKNKQIQFAKDNINQDCQKWNFSDEKEFNLNGPDGGSYYWGDKDTLSLRIIEILEEAH